MNRGDITAARKYCRATSTGYSYAFGGERWHIFYPRIDYEYSTGYRIVIFTFGNVSTGTELPISSPECTETTNCTEISIKLDYDS